MFRVLSLSALLLLTAQSGLAVAATPTGWAPLLEPFALATLLQQDPAIRILQVTGSFARGHIPGALASPYNDWRGPIENPGALHDLATFTALLQRLGIDAATPVVVVHAGSTPADMGAATRVYWTLKSLGVETLAVLNGGLQAWRDAGLPEATEEVTITPSQYVPDWHAQWRVTTEEVEALVRSGDASLFDARAPDYFTGAQFSFGRPGTIRGASNLFYESWFDGVRLKPLDALRSIYAEQGLPDSPVIVSFCNTGHWSSINWFITSELLGVSNSRLYAESMAEWSMAYRPMDNHPGRISIYTRMTLDWLQQMFSAES